MASDSSTEIIDGVEVKFKTGIDASGNLTRTVIVPLITPAREDQNGNDTADIPLRTLPSGAPALMAHLPVGTGLRMEGLQDAQPVANALALVTAQIAAHVPAAGQASMIDRVTTQGRWDLLTNPFTLSTIMPTVGADGAAGPIRLIVPPPFLPPPLTQSNTVVIDTNGQGDAVHLVLEGFSHAIITGAGTFEQVQGQANIIADDASQTILINGSGDRVSTGGGDDRIVVGQGSFQGFTHIDGGEGRDTVQLPGASLDDYRFDVAHDGKGGALVTFYNPNLFWLTYIAQNIEVLQFAEAIADTSERGSVTRLHESLLERAPTAAELDVWMRTLAGAASLEDVTQAILASGELAGQVPQANDAYIAWLYAQVLGRAADAGGLAHWTAALASGDISRAQLALALVDSDEKLQADASNQLAFSATDVAVLIRMYAALHDRAPDLDGLNFWIDRAEAGVSLADIADGFIAGSEATPGQDDATFIAQLYRSALEREATATELADWGNLLAQGYVDRGDVLLALADSAEMVALVGAMSTSFEVI